MELEDDIAQLREYAHSGSEPAFERVVEKRIHFVYASALRQVRDPEVAREVVQTVFLLLARKAASLREGTVLAGWLFRTTRFVALAHLRTLARRRQYEQEFQMEQSIQGDSSEQVWKQVAPMLDEALSGLRETDRRAVLLRFFEGKSLNAVGQVLAMSEDGARKRVERALEKLRRFFLRRGVSSTTAVLAMVFLAYGVEAAPAGLAKAVSATVVAQGATIGGSTLALAKGALKLMAWSKAQTAGAVVLVAGLTTVSVWQYNSHQRAEENNQALRRQLSGLQNDNESLSNQVTELANTQPPQPSPSSELLRLRGEVGVLRQQTNELKKLLANGSPQRGSRSAQSGSQASEDYPKTPQDATKGIFEALGRGDLECFVKNFGEPGVPKEMYDKIFGDEKLKAYLSGLEVLSVGEPTNSFGPNMYFVPYKIRLQDGTEKEMRLHIAQDPKTQKWFFKGGI